VWPLSGVRDIAQLIKPPGTKPRRYSLVRNPTQCKGYDLKSAERGIISRYTVEGKLLKNFRGLGVLMVLVNGFPGQRIISGRTAISEISLMEN
jgi:hypothetical protein